MNHEEQIEFIQQRGKHQVHRLVHAKLKMRRLDQRESGKHRFGFGNAPGDFNGEKYLTAASKFRT